MATINKDGHEILDTTPVEIRTKLRMPQSQAVRMRQFIQHELSRMAQETGHETLEEADDFSIPGEEWISPYEGDFDPLPIDSGAGGDKTAPPTGAAPTPPEGGDHE